MADVKKFEIGVHWPPLAEFINEEQYDYLKEADVTLIDHALETVQDNFKSLDLLYERGMKATCNDARCNDIYNADDGRIDEITDTYRNHPAAYGVYIIDEPMASKYEIYARIYQRMKSRDPEHVPYVNLFPIYADQEKQLAINDPVTLDQYWGDEGAGWVESDGAGNFTVGQSFKTPENIKRRLAWMELYLDLCEEGNSGNVSLVIYDSPSKNQMIASGNSKIAGSNHERKIFVHAGLMPDTAYYLELDFTGFTGRLKYRIREKNSLCGSNTLSFVNGSRQNFQICLKACYQSAYTDYLERWITSASPDFLMCDFYPFMTEGDRDNYFLNLELMKHVGTRYNISTAAYIQSVGITGHLRRPNENEMRYNVFTLLAYGLKKLNWFTWWTPRERPGEEVFTDAIITADGKKTDLYMPVQKLNKEIANLGPTLIGLNLQEVYHSGVLPSGASGIPREFFWKPVDIKKPVIISYFTDNGAQKYIMVVNRDYENSVSLEFVLDPSPSAIKEICKSTGNEIPVHYDPCRKVIFIELKEGEGRLYTLVE